MGGNDKDAGSVTKDITEKLSTFEDMQNLFQLDIINLKNEIERLKLVSTSPLTEEVGEKLVELEKMTKDVELFKRWKQTVDEVKFLREKVMTMPPEAPKPALARAVEKPAASDEIRELRSEIEQVRKDMRSKKAITPAIDTDDLKAAIEENRNAVENLKLMITEKPKGVVPDIDYIRSMTKENKRLLDDLRMKIEMSRSPISSETHSELEKLHNEIIKLEEEVKRMKEQRPAGKAAPKGEIDSLKHELYAKLDELNVKFGPRGSEEIRKAVEASRASIDKLKNLISGEEVTIEGLKKEVNENRKFMAEVKNLVLAKGSGTKKIQIPPDPEIRKKMLQLDQRIEFLGRKLDKMGELRPIKIPDFTSARGEKATPLEAETLRREIESIVSRMDGFLTKDEVEKGFLEKRMKADEKLLTGDTYKELNDIKKAIIRNEDHINSVAGDVEGIKKEIGTVEKREWGKFSEVPAIDDLKKRIDELERKIDEIHEGPVFIE
jgi:hypothetical protein